MTTANKSQTKRISETYRNPDSLAQNGLRYFVDHRNGQHVVVHEMHGGEDIGPSVKRFDRIEAARCEWKRLRDLLTGRGYTERVR